MGKVENVHDGHRQRMFEKLLNSPESFAEHELVEILLYYSIPRRNTNEQAHRLLKTFGGIKGLFEASYNQLTSVEGIGRNTALLILTVGATLKKAGSALTKQIRINKSNILEEIASDLIGQTSECVKLAFLDKSYKKIHEIFSTNFDAVTVGVKTKDFIDALVIYRPSYLIVVHNHPNAILVPSSADDFATKKLNALCELHGVNLIDHYIVNDEMKYYSYKDKGRLELIKAKSNIDTILTIGEINDVKG